MNLEEISLINYKNFESKNFNFDAKINCLVGPNGVGKTNVLDAIYLLAFGKSYFNPVTRQNIRHQSDFFVVDGNFLKNERPERIVVSAQKDKKKIIKRNGKAYERLQEHIGLIPVVIVSPTDRDLILEGSELRRKFMDGIIAQNDPAFLSAWVRYKKALSQRNALLKRFAATGHFQADQLAIYDDHLIEHGNLIFQKRRAFIDEFEPIFKKRYETISKGREEVSIKFKSQLLKTDFSDLLAMHREKDQRRQFSTAGTHKDDLKFYISGHPIKKFGSQGQQKSFLVALKLAQYDFIKQMKDVHPILLLDDVFDKLDENRVSEIVNLVTGEGLGQLFISDTHPERTEKVVQATTDHYKIFNLSD